MNKAKATRPKTNNKPLLIIGSIIGITIIAGIIVVLSNTTRSYAGTYNLDNRYSIVLKQDGTCDFAESGESGYLDNELKCNYEVKDGTVYFTRDIIRWSLEDKGLFYRGEGVGSNNTCEQFRGKYSLDNCKEEVVTIQETAAIGETGMIYKDKTYIKLH